MIPGQPIVSGHLTCPGVNFASVHGLTSVTVHMNFSLPPGQLREADYPSLYNTRLTGLAKVIFLHVNRTQKLPLGKSSLAHAHY